MGYRLGLIDAGKCAGSECDLLTADRIDVTPKDRVFFFFFLALYVTETHEVVDAKKCYCGCGKETHLIRQVCRPTSEDPLEGTVCSFFCVPLLLSVAEDFSSLKSCEGC